MRGIAIFLVVLGHSLSHTRGIATSQLPENLITIIFSFHMHVFFFISGVFGSKMFCVSKPAYLTILIGRIKRLATVYFAYTIVATAIKLAAVSVVRRPIDLNTLFTNVFFYPEQNPLLTLWFIYTLFVIQVLFLTWHLFIRMDYGKWLPTSLTFVVLLLLNFTSSSLKSYPFGLQFVAQYAVYFFTGFVAGRHASAIENWIKKHLIALLAMGLLYAIYAYVGVSYSFFNQWSPLKLIHAMIGILLTWATAVFIKEKLKRTQTLISLLAKYSYEIYLNEPFVELPITIINSRLLHWNPVIMFPLELLMGLLGPILLSKYFYRRYIVLRRFAIGDWKTSKDRHE